MSLPQFGYPPSVTATSLASAQLLMSTPPTSTAASGAASPCCENGRPVMTDPHTGQTICSCQYPAGLLAAYSRVPGLAEGVYPSPYAAPGLMSLGAADPSAFYPPVAGPCYTYDPTMGYPYANGFMDPNTRRKNATRESTNTLKAWLSEHRKNPYPTKGEKIMLAIITKMTLTQVSTWFANARRRLKKENKMTWSPRNRCDDDDDDAANSDGEHSDAGNRGADKKDDDDDDVLDDTEFINVDCDKDEEDDEREKLLSTTEADLLRKDLIPTSQVSGSKSSLSNVARCHNGCPSPHGSDCGSPRQSPGLPSRIPLHPGLQLTAPHPALRMPLHGLPHSTPIPKNTSAPSTVSTPSSQQTASKPKIWSLADVATSSDSHKPSSEGRKSPQSPQQSNIGPIRPTSHSIGGLPLGRSWATANGLSHPYSLGPHLLGLHRDPTAGGLVSTPTSSAILSRFGFGPISIPSSASIVDKRLAGGVAIPTPANR